MVLLFDDDNRPIDRWRVDKLYADMHEMCASEKSDGLRRLDGAPGIFDHRQEIDLELLQGDCY